MSTPGNTLKIPIKLPQFCVLTWERQTNYKTGDYDYGVDFLLLSVGIPSCGTLKQRLPSPNNLLATKRAEHGESAKIVWNWWKECFWLSW